VIAKERSLVTGVLGSLLVLLAGFWSAQSTADDLSKKVLQIWSVTKNGAGTGTGFFINDEGYIVTNHHVINGGVAFYAVPDGLATDAQTIKNNYKVDLVWSSSELDLAVLVPTEETLKYLKISPMSITSKQPEKGARVKAIGFPGVADAKNIDSADIKAESTISSGVLGRLIEDGVWRKGGAPLRLVQHSAFIHRGNSGGPLLDVCNRIIGVNTQGEVNIVRDGKGRGTGVGDLIAGFYYASDIRELIDILDKQDISYYLDSNECVSAEEKLTQTLQLALVVGGGGFFLIAGLVVYSMRSPAVKKRVAKVVETYSRSIRSSRDRPDNAASPNRHSPAPADSKSSLILDGYGPGGERHRLVIVSSDLFQGEVIVGRDPDNRANLINDDSISRRHCAFYAHGSQLFVRELNSTNGTFVDGRQLSPGESVSVRNGADIKLGSVSFKVISG
jgi:hypothetical protein